MRLSIKMGGNARKDGKSKKHVPGTCPCTFWAAKHGKIWPRLRQGGPRFDKIAPKVPGKVPGKIEN